MKKAPVGRTGADEVDGCEGARTPLRSFGRDEMLFFVEIGRVGIVGAIAVVLVVGEEVRQLLGFAAFGPGVEGARPPSPCRPS